MPNNIRIILINTYHPGNIGSTARAMKTMGLNNLYLVAPQNFPAVDAKRMAAGAQDTLANARVVSTFDESITDCSLVIGTSARSRNMPIPMLEPISCAEKLINESAHSQVALAFGQETMGMSNEDLLKCHYHVTVPANPEYPVMNISASAQILCYEIYQAHNRLLHSSHSLSSTDNTESTEIKPFPQIEQMELFYEDLENTLKDIGFIIRQHPGLAMTRLRRFFNRARPEIKELKMLRGILKAIQRYKR
ncbi:MAG: tRNA (cytosine(32)/uridine(32)-2'-O)-methyltransferase TrmJ [Candidatus Endonucleobacter bathymodioli]|uniref:tRNA (cytidine/uridine-2'-O-)-methyltransferase TrmJ n=1 Tax=Candidatus Endonucleibacter bathymodioli TaxID=539814 RepID=A0AA90NIS9_9GAMM|nr:tRNA (cytosine(32)/uridine(32)-2'-O)-methyltransferase TrmJ [Candidatus Endonucleobacter bathymodioli]